MNKAVLDFDDLMERVQNDKMLILELFDIFINDFAVKRKSLDEAAREKDYNRIANIIHSLKGASGNISAKSLRETLVKLEGIITSKNFDIFEDALTGLDKEFEELSVHIAHLRQELRK